MKILVAEDDALSLLILQTALEGWGYDPIITTDGLSAWEVLKRDDGPLLAILDIEMPGVDGLELCRRVADMAAPLPPYLILLTSFASKEDVTNGIQAGANDYLTKPFHRDELRVRIGNGARTLGLQSRLITQVKELQDALRQIKLLEGLLPICSYCKNIRNDQQEWQRIDSYISEKTDVEFTHDICPGCFEEMDKQYLKEVQAA